MNLFGPQQREIIINAQYVHSDLGGVLHGHIGLVLSPREYTLHSIAAYHKPNHPGPLIIPARTTHHMSNTLWDQHKDCLQVF